jgi:ABC-2 type transport system permease protein
MVVYVALIQATLRRNLVYTWAHMANNVGSVLFGLIYMALWSAADRGRTLGGWGPHTFLSYIALSQFILWVSTFLPAYLGIHLQVRSGQVALEFARPVGYMSRMLASGVGEVLYNVLFRSLPMALVFTFLGVFPWDRLTIPGVLPLVLVALATAGLMGVVIHYLSGLAAFWTTEPRWARRLFFALQMAAGGQILPLFLLPIWARTLVEWLPFQTMVWFPAAVWLGRATPSDWWSAGGWTCAMLLAAWLITRRAARRVEVQGG